LHYGPLEVPGHADGLAKNAVSDPTKGQEGQDWRGKDIMNDHQGKALSMRAVVKENGRWTSVSSKREE